LVEVGGFSQSVVANGIDDVCVGDISNIEGRIVKGTIDGPDGANDGVWSIDVVDDIIEDSWSGHDAVVEEGVKDYWGGDGTGRERGVHNWRVVELALSDVAK